MGSKIVLLKSDQAGRVRTPGELQAVAGYQRSGLSAKAFALQCGIRYNTFWNWLRKAGLTQARGAAQLVPRRTGTIRLVEVQPQLERAVLRVELPGGGALMVEHSGQVALAAQLIKALT